MPFLSGLERFLAIFLPAKASNLMLKD